MAVLETIRNKFGILITALIAVALLSFIIDPSSLSTFFGSNQDEEVVGDINGEEITYTDFHNKMQTYTDIYGNPQTPEHGEQLRMMVWEEFLLENLYVENAKKAGFNVGEEEMYQLLSGQVYSPVIFQNFQGGMTPNMLIEIEKQVNEDKSGMAKLWWDNLTKQTEYNRYREKYGMYLLQSNLSNSLLVEDEITSANNVFNVDFVMVPFSYAQDTTIVVSDKEINDYYEAHKNLFRQPVETRDIKYVVIEVNPSEQDILAAQAQNESISRDSLLKVTPPSQETLDEFYAKAESILAKAEDVESFEKAAIEEGYYAHPLNGLTMTSRNLGSVTGTERVTRWAFDSSKGSVSEIYTVGNNYIIAAVTGVTPEGYVSVETVSPQIKAMLYQQKAADKLLAEVSEKVKDLTDLNAVAEALGTTVSTKENVSFASNDLDPRFAGAASVAEIGVLNAPFKGSQGVYVYQVTDRSEKSFYMEDSAELKRNELNIGYMQMLPYILNMKGNVTDRTPLYF